MPITYKYTVYCLNLNDITCIYVCLGYTKHTRVSPATLCHKTEIIYTNATYRIYQKSIFLTTIYFLKIDYFSYLSKGESHPNN